MTGDTIYDRALSRALGVQSEVRQVAGITQAQEDMHVVCVDMRPTVSGRRRTNAAPHCSVMPVSLWMEHVEKAVLNYGQKWVLTFLLSFTEEEIRESVQEWVDDWDE